MDNNKINYNIPGIRLFIEDPQVAVKRQIRKSIWIISIMIVLTLSAILILQIKIKENTKELTQKQNTLASSLSSQNISGISESQLKEILPYKDLVTKALPMQTNLLDYQSALEKIAQNTGVLASISIPQSSTKKPTNVTSSNPDNINSNGLTHTIEIKGPIAGINQFISEIENMAYFVQIDSLSINSAGGTEKESNANLTLKVFTQ